MKCHGWLLGVVMMMTPLVVGNEARAEDEIPASELPVFALPSDAGVALEKPSAGSDLAPPPPAVNPLFEVANPGLMEEEPESPQGAMLTNFTTAQLGRETEQVVTLSWVGPSEIKVGKPFGYELVVRNVGLETVENVTVKDTFPASVKVVSVEPQAAGGEGFYTWRFGKLEPQEVRRIQMQLVAMEKGEFNCQALVTATSPSMAHIRVSEPKLQVAQSAAKKVMVGDSLPVTVAVSNPGDGNADNVIIHAQLSDGLKHESGSEFHFEIGTLGAGETRAIQVICSAIKGGNQVIRTTVVAEDGVLESTAESVVVVTEATLAVKVDGPSRRYLNRSAQYVVNISNEGTAPANNVKVTSNLPSGFRYTSSTSGGRYDVAAGTLDWFIGSIQPGETKQVAYKCIAIKPGTQNHNAVVSAHRGLAAKDKIDTTVEGIAALFLEVIDVDDPVEVGAQTAYEIRVTNQGSLEASNVVIQALVPPQMEVVGAQGPVRHAQQGQEVVFEPVKKLAPRANAIYRIIVRGTGVGDARFQTRLLSDSLKEPVIEEENTKVYAD
ncbi:Large cysteine-rich periplasmic protein OmcB precursor [Planctomycetes bacterium Pan216]|uniref:Large cysteine-rich periplasmic protein OmcB n=1 Tax=Kolteria novifilia TaxID=2527975 RepID=A0A518AX37_9BACT|nr:Large cysteine-rich periplasmic protein OmcB precursor [Planctomycetes bacterium Pan216]